VRAFAHSACQRAGKHAKTNFKKQTQTQTQKQTRTDTQTHRHTLADTQKNCTKPHTHAYTSASLSRSRVTPTLPPSSLITTLMTGLVNLTKCKLHSIFSFQYLAFQESSPGHLTDTIHFNFVCCSEAKDAQGLNTMGWLRLVGSLRL